MLRKVRDNFDMKRMRVTPLWLIFPAVAWGCLSVSALAESEADRAFESAQKAIAEGKFDQAIAQLDEALRQQPREAKFLGMRGVVWLRKGDYVRGSSDLKAAIGLNPSDAGTEYRPSNGATLKPDALEHGRRQVAQMLRDRPGMAQYGSEADFLRDWAARKFAGEDLGSQIDWDNSPPLHSDAEHLAPAENEHAAILVEANYQAGPNRGQPRAFEELWACAIYELHNVVYASQYVRLNKEAAAGHVSKKAFVAGILKYELRAAQETRAFYVQVYLPWAEKKKSPTDPSLWFGDWWDVPSAVLNTFTDKSAYPWRPYGRVHDWATVHLQWRRAKFSKAMTLLQKMRNEKGYEEDEVDVHYWIAHCFERLGKRQDAVNEWGEVIRLDPNNIDAYEARARLYEQLGDKKKADADLAKVKELSDKGSK